MTTKLCCGKCGEPISETVVHQCIPDFPESSNNNKTYFLAVPNQKPTELPKILPMISDIKVAHFTTKYQVRHAQRDADQIPYIQALTELKTALELAEQLSEKATDAINRLEETIKERDDFKAKFEAAADAGIELTAHNQELRRGQTK
jgi:hypothetical protein